MLCFWRYDCTALQTIGTLGYSCSAEAGLTIICDALQVGLLLAIHEAMRPTPRDRNLVGQGFEDPSRPGSLCRFPSPSDPPVLGLSVILPVKNDAAWLAATLPELLQTLQVSNPRHKPSEANSRWIGVRISGFFFTTPTGHRVAFQEL